MHRTSLLSLAVAAWLGLSGSAVAAPGLTVQGTVDTPSVWTAEQIRTTFADKVQPLDFSFRGKAHHATCVPLWALIDAAHPQFRKTVHNDSLTWVVTAVGGDGYRCSFSLGEIDPQVGDEAVWVALDEDGAPITGADGPMRLIVPSDLKPARWVHGMTTLTITPVP